ncbi:MAG: helix-turn-helix domain-containing protein, partial [Bacteroidota bacterium]
SVWWQLELLYGFGPTLFFYTKSLSDPSYKVRKKELIHFLPVLLEFIYYRSPFFRLGAIQLSESPETVYQWLFQMLQWGGLLSITIYLLLSLDLLKKYRQWLESRYSNLKDRALSWLETPIILYAVFWLAWMLLRVLDIFLFRDMLRPYYFNAGFLIVSLITYWIGLKGYVHSQIKTSGFLRARSNHPEPPKGALALPALVQDLQSAMEFQKFYLNPDLSLDKFALLTSKPEKLISKALNQCLGLNFHQFVNQYRVEAFKRNIQKKEYAHLTILGVAMESGFGSKSTFNLVFKKNTRMTPGQYLKKVQKEKS